MMLCGGIWFWLELTWTLWVPGEQMQANFMKGSIIGVWLWNFLEPWDSYLEWLIHILVAKNFKAACWLDQKTPTKRTLVSKEEQLTLIESSKVIEDTLVAVKNNISQNVVEEALFMRKERTVKKALDSSEEERSFKSPRMKKFLFFPFTQNCGQELRTWNLPGNSSQEAGRQPRNSKMPSFNKVEEV